MPEPKEIKVYRLAKQIPTVSAETASQIYNSLKSSEYQRKTNTTDEKNNAFPKKILDLISCITTPPNIKKHQESYLLGARTTFLTLQAQAEKSGEVLPDIDEQGVQAFISDLSGKDGDPEINYFFETIYGKIAEEQPEPKTISTILELRLKELTINYSDFVQTMLDRLEKAETEIKTTNLPLLMIKIAFFDEKTYRLFKNIPEELIQEAEIAYGIGMLDAYFLLKTQIILEKEKTDKKERIIH